MWSNKCSIERGSRRSREWGISYTSPEMAQRDDSNIQDISVIV